MLFCEIKICYFQPLLYYLFITFYFLVMLNSINFRISATMKCVLRRKDLRNAASKRKTIKSIQMTDLENFARVKY